MMVLLRLLTKDINLVSKEVKFAYRTFTSKSSYTKILWVLFHFISLYENVFSGKAAEYWSGGS